MPAAADTGALALAVVSVLHHVALTAARPGGGHPDPAGDGALTGGFPAVARS